MKTTEELFIESKAKPIRWQGLKLEGLYQLPTNSQKIIVHSISTASDFSQAINLKIRGGELKINNYISTHFVLWEDNVPPVISIDIYWKNSKNRCLHLWNSWQNKNIIYEWYGNYGMQIKKQDRLLNFLCSDGMGDFNSDNLKFSVEIIT